MELRMKAPIQNYISKVLMLFEEGYIRYQSLLTGFCPLKSLQGTIFIAVYWDSFPNGTSHVHIL